MYDEFPNCPRCHGDHPNDGPVCNKCQRDIDLTDGGPQHHDLHAERMAMLFRDAEADDYDANCTPLNAAQQRAKELIEAELAVIFPAVDDYGQAGMTW